MLLTSKKLTKIAAQISGYFFVGILIFSPDKDDGIKFIPAKAANASFTNTPLMTLKIGEKARKSLGDRDDEAEDFTVKVTAHKQPEGK